MLALQDNPGVMILCVQPLSLSLSPRGTHSVYFLGDATLCSADLGRDTAILRSERGVAGRGAGRCVDRAEAA